MTERNTEMEEEKETADPKSHTHPVIEESNIISG